MPKRKTAASEEGAEDATGGAERQRLRPDSGRAQAQPGSGALGGSLSFGKAVAAMLALKERSVAACGGKEAATRRQREALLNVRMADVFGMQVKAVDYGKNDVRAVEDCQAVSATKVDEYLWRAFDGRMEEAEAAFGRLAAAYPAAEIGTVAYRLFTQFRPAVPPGPAGSGRAQKGLLRLERVRELASMVRRA